MVPPVAWTLAVVSSLYHEASAVVAALSRLGFSRTPTDTVSVRQAVILGLAVDAELTMPPARPLKDSEDARQVVLDSRQRIRWSVQSPT